jgi:hypothetical protein
MGIAALSIDAAYMYDRRNRLHAAADAAAKSAVLARLRNSSADVQAFANHEVTALGLAPVVSCGATGGTSVCVNRPPSSGAFAGNSNYVEVIVSERSIPTFFGKVAGWSQASPGARAVAGAADSQYCIISLNDFTVGNTCPYGHPTFKLNGCGVAAGGTLYGNNPNSCLGGAPLPTVDVTRNCSGTCSSMGSMTTGAAAPADPLVSLPAFTNPYGSCAAAVPDGSGAINPGCYTSIPSLVTRLNPGEYYLSGTWNVNNTTANGVFVYLAGTARIRTSNNSSLTLSAMSTPGTYTGTTYNGVAVFQARSDNQNFDGGNNSNIALTGALYFPGADIVFGNSLNFTQTQCSLIIARSIDINNGASDWTTTGCTGLFGSAAFLSARVSE